MIARLANIQRAHAEIEAHGFNCIRIRPTDGKGQFGSRVNITPAQVSAYLDETNRDFQGEYIVELWKHGSKDEQTKYVVSNNGGGNAQMNGAAMGGINPMILTLMQQAHAKDMEILTMKLEAKYGGDDGNYLKEGIGMMRELLLRNKNGHTPEPERPAQPQRLGSDHAEGDAEGDEDEGTDVFDDFIDVEPEAEEIIARLIKLKSERPSTYAEALNALKNM